MKSPIYPRSHRAAVARGAAQLVGLVAVVSAFSGCARRPIVVNAPPATVVQSPAPATVVHTPAPAPAPAPTGREVIVIKEPPPPPREETPPPPPPSTSSSYTWVPGYWTVRDGRQEWVPGRYETPPRTGAIWVAPRWERRADGYVFVEGYWR